MHMRVIRSVRFENTIRKKYVKVKGIVPYFLKVPYFTPFWSFILGVDVLNSVGENYF